MTPASANGASPMTIVASSPLFRGADLAGFDPRSATCIVAVDTLVDGGVPLFRSVLETCFEIVGDVFEDCAERYLVEATFRRPLLLILNGDSYETSETVAAVAVTWHFDRVWDGEIIEARDAFAATVTYVHAI